MIQQPTNYAPTQLPASEFNAIKINIQGAKVDAPGALQQSMPAQQPQIQQPIPQYMGQNINYSA